MTAQLMEMQKVINQDEDRLESLEMQLAQQRELVQIVSNHWDRAEEEVDEHGQAGQKPYWQQTPEKTQAEMNHMQLEIKVKDLKQMVNVLADENEELRQKLSQEEAGTVALKRDA